MQTEIILESPACLSGWRNIVLDHADGDLNMFKLEELSVSSGVLSLLILVCVAHVLELCCCSFKYCKISKYSADRILLCCCFCPQRSGRSPQRDFRTDSRSHTSVNRWNSPQFPRGRSQQQAGSRRKLPHVAPHNHAQVRTSEPEMWQERSQQDA